MLETPEIAVTPPQQIAVIRCTIPKAAMRDVMGPGIRELISTVMEQGIGPSGPWFAHHIRMNPEIFDFEIGVPVTAKVQATGRVESSLRPELTVAKAVLRGGYEGLPAAWPKLDAWVREQGHLSALDLWECYVAGPETSADPAQWRTELHRPLIALK